MCWHFIKSNELQTKVCETDTNEKQFTSWLWIALVSYPKEQLRPWLPLTTMRKLNGISKILITPDRCMQKIILKNDIFKEGLDNYMLKGSVSYPSFIFFSHVSIRN